VNMSIDAQLDIYVDAFPGSFSLKDLMDKPPDDEDTAIRIDFIDDVNGTKASKWIYRWRLKDIKVIGCKVRWPWT
jgi:hypothetical protein